MIGESDVPSLGAIVVLITVHYLNQYLDNIKSKWVLREIRSQIYRTIKHLFHQKAVYEHNMFDIPAIPQKGWCNIWQDQSLENG